MAGVLLVQSNVRKEGDRECQQGLTMTTREKRQAGKGGGAGGAKIKSSARPDILYGKGAEQLRIATSGRT